jgi:hypothetical protein
MASKNVIIALLAMCGIAYGQTRSLLVDTSGIVQYTNAVQWQGALSFGTNTAAQSATRSNLSLGLPALTNTTGAGLLSAIGGLATNGNAAGLTNLPNSNLSSNAVGVLPIASGGTGQTNAASAIQALLPSYTGNSNNVLALNSNATALVWTTNVGGGTNYTNAQDAMLGLFFASTNNDSINLFVNGGTNAANQHTVIGSGASAYGTNASDKSVAIGTSAETSRDGIAIGFSSSASRGLSIGYNSDSTGSGVALGWNAIAAGGSTTNGAVAVGRFATAQTNSSIAIGDQADADGIGAIAIGRLALALEDTNGVPATAIGIDADAYGRSVAIGASTSATGDSTVAIGPNANGILSSIAIGDGAAASSATAIQLGKGTNNDSYTIQIWNAGTISTNEWAALANATTIGTNLLQATNTTNAQIIIGLTNPATYPSFSNAASKVLAVTTNESGVEWIAVSNTVTDASTLTNFPASILQTNSAEGSFPAFLLRTNGNASGLTFPAFLLTTNGNGAGLTNLTAANVVGTVGLASNVSGTIAVANGGTGATTASNARVNLLPSYSGNASRVLALNSNATDLVWAVDGGGVADMSNVTNTLAIANGGSGATTANGALTNFGILVDEGGGAVAVRVGSGQTYTNSGSAVIVGNLAFMSNSTGSIAIGNSARADRGSKNIAIGNVAVVSNVANSVQLGEGVNSTGSTIQFLTAGTVNATEWGYLANASTRGGYAMTNTAAISTNRTFVSYDGTNFVTNSVTISNGIITGWTQ